MEKLTIFGGTGFVGGNFFKNNPTSCQIVPREYDKIDGMTDVLYFISTTHNYNVFTDVHKDIDTNLTKLMNVLPNVNGTFNFISSWFVYGSGYGKHNPAKETDYCNPKGFYSVTKLAAERLVESYCKTFKKNYRILRLCNVVGGDGAASNKKNALEYMIGNISRGDPINLYNGDNYRNILHVEDVCSAIKLVTEKGKLNEIYNIGANDSTRINDIVEYVMQKTNSKTTITYMDPPEFHQIVQSPNFFMDCEKLRNLGFRQKYNTTQAVEKILESL